MVVGKDGGGGGECSNIKIKKNWDLVTAMITKLISIIVKSPNLHLLALPSKTHQTPHHNNFTCHLLICDNLVLHHEGNF